MEEDVGDPFSDLLFVVQDTVSAQDTLVVDYLQVEADIVGGAAVVASMR